MKKLIFLVRHFTPNSGSYAGMIEEVSKYAHLKGYKIKIFCAQLNKELKLNEKQDYAEIIRFPVFSFQIPLIGMNIDYISLAYHVKKYFQKHNLNKEDIIIANGRAALGVLNKKYFLRMGQPALTFLKNMEIAKDQVSLFTRIARIIHFKFQSILENKCVKNAQAFILPSLKTKNHILSYYGGKTKPYFIPFAGINYDLFQKGRNLNFKGRNILVISAGKEKVRKGIIYLERVLPKIFERYSDVNVMHVGEKFKWDIPKRYENRITSVGKIPWVNMKNYFVSSTFFVITSLQEGFPNVILESMSTGCPVLTSDLDGIKEYIKHLNSGYIFQRGNLKELEKGINYMLNNPKKLTYFKEKAKAKIKKLDYSSYSTELLNFLKNILKGKKINVNLLRRCPETLNKNKIKL